MKAGLKNIAKKLAYLFVAFILLIATITLAMALLTPVLNQHRKEIEKFTSQLLYTDIKLSRIKLGWYGYQPSVTLREVTVFNQKTHDPILQIEKISIVFSLPKSIWHLRLIPSVILISGSHIDIDKEKNGLITVQGYPLGSGFSTVPYQQETRFLDVMGWISSQPSLMLHDINIRLLTDKAHEQNITLFNLNFNNSGETHQILGKAILQQTIPTEVNLAIEWLGKETDLSKIKAKIYLYVSGLSLPQWIKGESYAGWEVKQGLASIKLWATWKDNAWHKAQSLFQFYEIELYSQKDKQTHLINRLSGHLGWRQEKENTILAGDDLLLDLPEHFWPVSHFYFSYQKNATQEIVPQSLNIGYLNLADVQGFLFSSLINIPVPVKEMLAGLQPHGGLHHLAITFPSPGKPWETAQLSTDFTQLSLLPWHQLPGVDHLSGSLKWHDGQGILILNSTNAWIEYAALFKKPFDANQLTADIEWQTNPNRDWAIKINRFQLMNDDAVANLQGTMLIPEQKMPEVNLTANLAILQINRLAQYLPIKTFEPELEKWLKDAFTSGEIKSANMTIRGSLADFPFDHGNGLFEVKSTLSNVNLHYAPGWPALSHASGELIFSGRKMLVNLDHATLADMSLTQVAAEIPYLGADKPQTLWVKMAPVHTEAAKLWQLLQASPLASSLGKLLDGINLEGPASLQLALQIPLAHPEKTLVQGNLTLQEAKLNLIPWHLSVLHLNGEVDFSENATQAKNLSGSLFSQPIQINIAKGNAAQSASTQVNFHTVLMIKDLEAWLNLPLQNYATGLFTIEGQLNLGLNIPLTTTLKSDLAGLQVRLPAPYGKTATETRATSALMEIEDKKAMRAKIQYGKDVAAVFLLDKQNESWHVSAINFHLGTGEPAWPKAPGLFLSGNFAELNWDKIKDYWQQSDVISFNGPALKSIDINADVLTIGNTSVKKVTLSIQPITNFWNLRITSPDVVGTLQIPTHFVATNTLSARFDRLNLVQEQQKSSDEPTAIVVNTLPMIRFIANSVMINHLALGQVSFNTHSALKGLKIDNLRITNPNLEVQASGTWTQVNQSSVASLQGKAVSAKLSQLLTSFGIDMHNVELSNGELKFAFNWPAPPYALSLAKLNGQANMKLGKGRIADVGKNNSASMGLGRMLSIFSLQSIPRRLTFDFSDLFQDGYSFDDVTGDFTLQKGNAMTNNLQFNGPVAKVNINGRIGLSQKDYDFTLSVTPFVTASIPVAATLLTGQPWVGLAALVMNTLVGSQVSKATAHDYAVKGPWDNPTWKSVDKKK